MLLIHITSLSSAQANSQNIRCELEIIDEHYTCTILSANVYDENLSIQFDLTHLGNKNDRDVTQIRKSSSFNGTIKIFHKQILEKFVNLQVILLHDVGMVSLPVNSFEKCDEIVELDFNENSLEILADKMFENCKKLKALSLSFNNLMSLSNKTFEGPENLEILKLNSNFIEKFSQSYFKNLTNLKELDLGNPMRNFTYESTILQHLKNLEAINLESWNLKFENIEYLIDKLTKLKKISITNNPLPDITFGFFNQFQNLEILNLNNCSISGIQNQALRNFPKIKEFSLKYNFFKSITKKTFEELGSLEVLRLGHNIIESLETKSFEIHFQLKELDLSNNKIKSLNADLLKFQTKLQRLDISSNGIETLGGLFRFLEKVEVIDFSNNNIKKLNSNTAGNLQFLTEFSASFNQIDEIQRNFFDTFPNLDKVKFKSNLCVDAVVENFQQINVTSVFGQCFDNFEGLTTTTTSLPTTTNLPTTTIETTPTDIPASTTSLISTDNPSTYPISTTVSTSTLKKTTTTMTVTTTTSIFVPSTPSSTSSSITQSTTSRSGISTSTVKSTTTDLISTTKGTGIANILGISVMVLILSAVRNLIF